MTTWRAGRVQSGCTGNCSAHAPLDKVCDWCARHDEPGRVLSPQSVARRWLHDLVCMSEGCQGDDHAKRTQATFATQAVRDYKAGKPLAPVIHKHSCLGCDDPKLHVTLLAPVAEELRQRLGL